MNQKHRLIASVVLLATMTSCSSQMASVPTANEPSQAVSQSAAGGEVRGASAPTPEKVEQINTDPANLTLAFYEYYVDGFPRIDDERVVFARYLTSRFFDVALKADDYDPFLDAQDFDETWKNNVSVSDKVITGNKATVNVTLKGKTFKWVLKVSLLKKAGTWRIDGVKQVKQP